VYRVRLYLKCLGKNGDPTPLFEMTNELSVLDPEFIITILAEKLSASRVFEGRLSS
jgi:hypothetical protein